MVWISFIGAPEQVRDHVQGVMSASMSRGSFRRRPLVPAGFGPAEDYDITPQKVLVGMFRLASAFEANIPSIP